MFQCVFVTARVEPQLLSVRSCYSWESATSMSAPRQNVILFSILTISCHELLTELSMRAVGDFLCYLEFSDNNNLVIKQFYINLYTGSNLDLWKGTKGTEYHPARMRFQVRFLEGLHHENMLCVIAAGGCSQGDGCRKTKWLAGKRGDNLGFLGLCQSSPADRMATAEGPCCEGGCSFLLKDKRGVQPHNPHCPPVHVFLQPLLIASQGIFNSCFLKAPLSSTAIHDISQSLHLLPRTHTHCWRSWDVGKASLSWLSWKCVYAH